MASGGLKGHTVKIERVWAMPNAATFDVPPIRDFVARWLYDSQCSVDPFARNSQLARWTNDIDPATGAEYHMDAEDFCKQLAARGKQVDVVLLDPPYSPTQLARSYRDPNDRRDYGGSQNAALYKRVRNALMPLLTPQAVVLSFGWNTCGMGPRRGFAIEEILIVCHGGAHNDTLCMAERRIGDVSGGPGLPFTED